MVNNRTNTEVPCQVQRKVKKRIELTKYKAIYRVGKEKSGSVTALLPLSINYSNANE